MKKCAFPKCQNKGASRGKKDHGELARFKWCHYHRKGEGKKERLMLPLPIKELRVKL